MQIAATGAAVEAIPGTRQEVTEAALAATGASFYASHNWQPFFIEGTKTLAFELWEQLGFAVPDNILVPTGYGSNILGLDRGFAELNAARRDRPHATALRGAGGELRGLCRGLERRRGRDCAVRRHATIADGIATVQPVRVAEVLRALAPLKRRRRRGPRGRDRAGAPQRSAGSGSLSSRPRRPPARR